MLRMIENYVGAETFRKGVNAYLQAHAYGNATSQDFWDGDGRRRPASRSTAILPTFVNQPGVPLRRASRLRAGDNRTQVDARAAAVLSRSGALLRRGSAERVAGAGLREDRAVRRRADLRRPRQPRQTLTLDADAALRAVGVRQRRRAGLLPHGVRPEMLRALAPHVEDALTAPERLSLVGDEWALVRAGRHGVGDYLTLASGFGSERTGGVLGERHRPARLHPRVSDDRRDARPRSRRSSRTLLRPAVRRRSASSRRPATATSAGRCARRSSRRSARPAATPTSSASARAALDRALAGGAPLDPTLAGAIVAVAAEHGDAPLLRRAAGGRRPRRRRPTSTTGTLYALARLPGSGAHRSRASQYALSPKLRSQDTALFLARFLAQAGRAAAHVGVPQGALDGARAEDHDLRRRRRTSSARSASFCDAGVARRHHGVLRGAPLPSASRTLNQTRRTDQQLHRPAGAPGAGAGGVAARR